MLPHSYQDVGESKGAELPSWLFDIDEDDEEFSNDTTLLQELEIDPEHIYK